MNRQDIVIVGAGGLGREVLWQIGLCNEQVPQYNILGFVDDDKSLQGKNIDGVSVIGGIDWLSAHNLTVGVVLAIGSGTVRRAAYQRLCGNPAISYPTIIAPGVRMSNKVTYGHGCILCLDCLLTVNVILGDFVVVNPACRIGHDSTVGDFSTLYWDVTIAGSVSIGAACELGSGSCVTQGVRVGDNSIIGAGAVVVRDIPSGCTAVGCPAKPIKFHKPYNV